MYVSVYSLAFNAIRIIAILISQNLTIRIFMHVSIIHLINTSLLNQRATFEFLVIIIYIIIIDVVNVNSVFPGLCQQDAVHITAILGESVVFNCHVEFPGEHPVPYVLQWEKKVGDTVRYRTTPSAL